MESLILVGATLIDGTGAEPVRGRAVVVEQGRIAQVVDIARAPRGRRVDLEGHTLLPGLLNCHVHLCLGAEADPVRALKDEPAALTALKALRRAQETVEAGVTTVRDLGGREYVELAVRRAIAEGHFPGPRILAAGRPICMTGGHGNFLGREADGPDDARKAGRRTAAHAQGSTGIADAIEAGITTIEHGIYLTDEIIASMKGKGVFLVPTLAAPAAICAGGVAAGIPEYMVRKSETVAAHHLASFQRATQAGVSIAAGADSGTPFNPNGSLLPELELMVKHGMSPLEAIRSATAVAAQALGIENETGRIAPGLAADLVAVAGEAAERIQALADIRLVLARGAMIKSP